MACSSRLNTSEPALQAWLLCPGSAHVTGLCLHPTTFCSQYHLTDRLLWPGAPSPWSVLRQPCVVQACLEENMGQLTTMIFQA